MNAFRGTTYAVGAGLAIWGLLFLLVTPLGGIGIAVGALIVLAAGLADWLHRDQDCGFTETIYGTPEPQYPALRLVTNRLDDEIGGMWPGEVGAP